jgi:hypothetical protein
MDIISALPVLPFFLLFFRSLARSSVLEERRKKQFIVS